MIQGLSPNSNLIIVSDHGMMQILQEKVIYLDDLIDIESVQVTDSGPITMLNARMGTDLSRLYQQLQSNATHNHYTVYLSADMHRMAPQWHFDVDPRIGDIVIVCEIGYYLTLRKYNGFPYGMHGWAPEAPEMQAIYFATGPCFKEAVTAEQMENTEVYTSITRCLGLDDREVDGTSAGSDILRSLMTV